MQNKAAFLFHFGRHGNPHPNACGTLKKGPMFSGMPCTASNLRLSTSA
jgi:hypothetical protein